MIDSVNHRATVLMLKLMDTFASPSDLGYKILDRAVDYLFFGPRPEAGQSVEEIFR